MQMEKCGWEDADDKIQMMKYGWENKIFEVFSLKDAKKK